MSECDLCGYTTVASLSEDIVAYLLAAVSGVFFLVGSNARVFSLYGISLWHPHEENTPGIYDALSIASVSLNSL